MGRNFTKAVILKIVLVGLYIATLGSVLAFILHGQNVAVLMPQGTIASQQRSLMILAALLMLIVVIPVFILTFVIAWKYRASNENATHSPDWDRNRLLEAIWWGLPCAIIAVLAVVAWTTSHSLDPYRALKSDKDPIKVQVVALEWKWLFIYPDQKIATVNYLQFPQNTPIDFQITSDAPMNSFWIPSLGGQIYAMSGMTSQLHLMADKVGSYQGSSANISGEGFSGMRFAVDSVTDTDFMNWVQSVKKKSAPLDASAYAALAKPSKNVAPAYYNLAKQDLYDTIINKYMGNHTADDHDGDSHDSMEGMN
jgi:cytochrome o ubiquinol oxidase subunit 2